ncbi:MAG TPA: COQ9 family protein [Alphaproteobacteria bacterium]|jgi:ubiquinone biosynthesis protein COQ9|nr:COQ9 family protein [Alphaproteobacteria bacterium]|tara:strand:- start:171 stop:830 length:660 start_codon:yes stop_codon:yes gene_type:complete
MVNESKKFERERKTILNRALIDIENSGFNEKMLLNAAKNCKISEGKLGRLFPEGIFELKQYYFSEIDEQMLQKIKTQNYENIRVRDKIFNGVLIRLELFKKNKTSIKYIFVSESSNPIKSLKHLWRTSDLIWKSAGDSSTDYNHYTKRLLLSWVYITTLICWFNDKSRNINDTKLFLNRRIDEVLEFGKQSGKIKSKISKLNITNKLINIIKDLKSIKV